MLHREIRDILSDTPILEMEEPLTAEGFLGGLYEDKEEIEFTESASSESYDPFQGEEE